MTLDYWHHLVGTCDSAGNLKIYLDGTLVGSASGAPSRSMSQGMIIGSYLDGTTYFHEGEIDQVRVFDYVLGQEAVNSLYNDSDTPVIIDQAPETAFYKFNDNAYDSAGSFDGTTSNITYANGLFGKAAVFNGSSSYINTNYTLPADTTFAFSWWMNASLPSSGNNFIVNNGNGTVHDGTFAIYVNSSNQLGMWIGDNSTVTSGLLTITGGVTGSWMHFAVSINGSTVTVYKNGSLAGTLTLTSHSTAAVLTLIIGRLGHYSGNYLNGLLDQFRIFDQAISSNQVSDLYNEASSAFSLSTLQAYYKLDNSAIDEASGFDGTETNVEYRFGRYGQAAVFNGSSSIISATQPSGLNGPCTYSVWLKTTSSSYQSIITVGSVTGSHTAGVNLFVNSGKLSCQTGNGSNTENSNVNSTSNIDAGNWVHCAVVVAGSTQGSSIKVYVNGQEEGSGTADNTAIVAASSESLCLGGRILSGSQSTFLNGSLDQVRIFTSALSPSQVTELYNEKPETDTSNFKTVVYDGTGGSDYISNVGIDLESNGGLIWFKERNGTNHHQLYDNVRGYNYALYSNLTNAQYDYSAHSNGDLAPASVEAMDSLHLQLPIMGSIEAVETM